MRLMRIFTAIVLIMTLGAVMASAQDETLYSDTFTGRDGGRPQNWTIEEAADSGFWYIINGEFSTGNGDDLINQDGYSFAYVSVPGSDSWKDYIVECSVWTSQTNGRVLLAARWVDRDNHYEGVLETFSGKRILRIEKVIKGKRSVLARVEHGVDGITIPQMENGSSSADARLFQMSVVGSKITLSLAGVRYLEADDNSLPSGTVGLGQWYHHGYFDNFIVRQATAGALASVSRIPTEYQPISEPATLPSGENIFRILIGQGLDDPGAKSLKNQLIEWGYMPVEIFPNAGNFDVYIGAFYSKDEASRAKTALEEEGLSPRDIVSLSGEQAAEVARSAVAAPAARVNYRVLANEFPDISTAQQMKKTLEESGYFPVDLAEVSGKHKVYIGIFNNSDEAKILADVLQSEGYDFAKVVEEAVTATSPDAVVLAQATPSPITSGSVGVLMDGLTPQQKTQLESIINQQSSGGGTASEIIEMKNKIQQLDDISRRILTDIQSEREKERQKQIAFNDLYLKAQRSRDQGKWDEALESLDQARDINPSDVRIERMIKSIELARKNITFEGEDVIQQQNAQKIKASRELADRMEKENNFDAAARQWEVVMSIAKSGSMDETDAKTALGRLEGLRQDQKKRDSERQKRNQLLIYGVVGLVVVLLVLIIFFGFKSRKHDQELLRQVQELTLKPLLELKEGKGPAAIEDLSGQAQAVSAQAMAPAEAPGSPGKTKTPLAPEPAFPDFPEMSAPPAPDLSKPSAKTAKAPKSSPRGKEPKKELETVKPKPAMPEVDFAMPDISDMIKTETRQPVKEHPPESEFQSVSLTDLEIIDDAVIDTTSNISEESTVKVTADIDDLLGEESVEDDKLDLMSSKEMKPADEEDTVVPEISRFSKQEIPVTPASEEEITHHDMPVVAVPTPSPVASVPVDLPTQTAPVVQDKSRVETEQVEQPKPVMPAPQPVAKSEPEKPAPVVAATAPQASTVTVSPAPSVQAASPGAQPGADVVFEQNFDDEETGVLPNQWRGEYSYATLKVSEDSPAPDSKKCVEFEKTKGAGSAFYSCRFPDTGGTVGIEFDFRCDKKNKYLLGFYIEKDEDYRYSVHTVIQFIDSGRHTTKPSLRIQGKPVSYEWGQWRHIKYVVNLNSGSVDGWVDGELVANGERLASCPSSFNTISIRDNLATVGKLMIDNIKIYKA